MIRPVETTIRIFSKSETVQVIVGLAGGDSVTPVRYCKQDFYRSNDGGEDANEAHDDCAPEVNGTPW